MCLLAGQCEISTRSWSTMQQELIKEKLASPEILETPHYTSINSYSLLLEPLAKFQINEFLENSNQVCLFMGRVDKQELFGHIQYNVYRIPDFVGHECPSLCPCPPNSVAYASHIHFSIH